MHQMLDIEDIGDIEDMQQRYLLFVTRDASILFQANAHLTRGVKRENAEVIPFPVYVLLCYCAILLYIMTYCYIFYEVQLHCFFLSMCV